MFKHLFKLIWNKKKQNSLLIFEMLVSFMVIFAVFSSIVYFYRNYLKPMGMEYEHVWLVSYQNHEKFSNSDSLVQYYETLRRTLKGLPAVRELSFTSGNTPFANQTNGAGLTFRKKKLNLVNVFHVEDSYKDVLSRKMLEGRWLEKQDAVARNRHIVINETLKEMTFGKENAVGQLIDSWNEKEKFEVIGVVNDTKDQGDYSRPLPGFYQRADTSAFYWLNHILIRVSPDAGAAFESRLYKTLASSMKNANIEIRHLDDMLVVKNKFTLVPMIIALIVAGFLIVNVALGLFGVLWYNINKRRGEIGLRRAVGASGRSVSGQLVSESLILATLALIIGVFFAIQFPLLHVFDLPSMVYIIAMLLSVLFIYLLVLVCSLYPGKQAAGIYPAVALHED